METSDVRRRPDIILRSCQRACDNNKNGPYRRYDAYPRAMAAANAAVPFHCGLFLRANGQLPSHHPSGR
ncbi:MAG TPA: hypothetical protein VF934_02225, partial [Burkholderiales bacterium]